MRMLKLRHFYLTQEHIRKIIKKGFFWNLLEVKRTYIAGSKIMLQAWGKKKKKGRCYYQLD